LPADFIADEVLSFGALNAKMQRCKAAKKTPEWKNLDDSPRVSPVTIGDPHPELPASFFDLANFAPLR
jgi:hypothetical protein